MSNQEGGFFRKMARVIPGTEENKKGEAVHGLYEQKKIEDHERIVTALQEQVELFKKHDMVGRIRTLTAEGVRELDLKKVSPELDKFYSSKLPELRKKDPQGMIDSRVLIAGGRVIADLFEMQPLGGKSVGSNARLIEITPENMANEIAWASVDENAVVSWRTVLDQMQDYERRMQDKTGK